MNYQEILIKGSQILKLSNIKSFNLDSEILLSSALKIETQHEYAPCSSAICCAQTRSSHSKPGIQTNVNLSSISTSIAEHNNTTRDLY